MTRLRTLFAMIAAAFAALILLASPALADATISQVVMQSFLSDVLYAVVTIAVIIGLALLKNVAAVHNNKALSDTLTKLAMDAAHYGIAYGDAKITSVRGIPVSDPQLATAANWLLNAADGEIKSLNLSDDSVIAAVAAILPQAKAALVSSQPATQGKS